MGKKELDQCEFHRIVWNPSVSSMAELRIGLWSITALLAFITFLFFLSFCSLGSNSTARAYLNFVTQEDLIEFTEIFDGYVFVDSKGRKISFMVVIDTNRFNCANIFLHKQ